MTDTPDGHGKQKRPRITILGVGNLLLQDEGVGIHLLRLLESRSMGKENVELIDVGTCVDVSSFIEDRADKMIILDAVKGGQEPGTLYRIPLEKLERKWDTSLSLHQTCVLDSLKILEMLGRAPRETVVIGIEPRVIDWGTDLTPEIQSKLTKLADLVTEEILKTTASDEG